jgi:hypothetical protein
MLHHSHIYWGDIFFRSKMKETGYYIESGNYVTFIYNSVTILKMGKLFLVHIRH